MTPDFLHRQISHGVSSYAEHHETADAIMLTSDLIWLEEKHLKPKNCA